MVIATSVILLLAGFIVAIETRSQSQQITIDLVPCYRQYASPMLIKPRSNLLMYVSLPFEILVDSGRIGPPG